MSITFLKILMWALWFSEESMYFPPQPILPMLLCYILVGAGSCYNCWCWSQILDSPPQPSNQWELRQVPVDLALSFAFVFINFFLLWWAFLKFICTCLSLIYWVWDLWLGVFYQFWEILFQYCFGPFTFPLPCGIVYMANVYCTVCIILVQLKDTLMDCRHL